MGRAGWIERVHEALALLKGEEAVGHGATTLPAADGSHPPVAGAATGRPATADLRPALSEDAERIAAMELQRREREIQDGWRMLEIRQLALVREKETLEQDRKRRQEQRRRSEKAGDGGATKELEVLAGLKAKQAKELLRQKQDTDVTRILMAMEDRRVRKIVGECKTNEERLWIGRVLAKFHERDATQAEVLDASP